MNRIGDARLYLDLYGNMTRKELPFGEVDYMILSQLVYAPLENLIGDDRGKTIRELTPLVWETGEKTHCTKDREELWYAVAETRRFSSLTLDMFVSIMDKEKKEQFAAAVFADGADAIISFRGTDSTIVGWKEDFDMCYMDEVPSERHAAKMLEGIASFYSTVAVTGHSKGGILAVYSAYMVSSMALDRVVSIWSYDGPGLPPSYTGGARWDRVSALTHAFIPESSVVGIIFNSLATPKIVETKALGLFQHNPLTWRIEGRVFDETDDTTLFSKLAGIAMKNILEGCTTEERETVVNSVYGVIESTGRERMTELPEAVIAKRRELREAIEGLSPKAREAMAELMHVLWDGRREGLEEIERKINIFGRDE